MDINLIRKWVSRGEDDRLEFKLKANHPEKIIREIVAFANTRGGYLIVGVSDDRKIVGLKYPDEALFGINKALHKFCKPELTARPVMVTTPDNRKLLVYHVPRSEALPHFVETTPGDRKVYFRVGENSIQASPELCTILERSRELRNNTFTYGETEHKLMQLLDNDQTVTVDTFAAQARIPRREAADVLVLMVLANVVRIHPGEAGDRFSMRPVSAPIATRTYFN